MDYMGCSAPKGSFFQAGGMEKRSLFRERYVKGFLFRERYVKVVPDSKT